MDLLRSSASVKKLKQAQLPFLLDKQSPKSPKEDKENFGSSTFSAAKVTGEDERKFPCSFQDTAVVDLTNSDNSQDGEACVTSNKEADSDIKSSKMHRKRTASHKATTSKKAVLSKDVLRLSQYEVSGGKLLETTQEIPKIRIVPATPVGYKSKLSDFCTPIMAAKRSEPIDIAEDTQLQNATKPAVMAPVETEGEKSHGKEKHKYAPLSSILCRKRTRSKSPPQDKNVRRDRIWNEKNKKMGAAICRSRDEGLKDVIFICPKECKLDLDGIENDSGKFVLTKTHIDRQVSNVLVQEKASDVHGTCGNDITTQVGAVYSAQTATMGHTCTVFSPDSVAALGTNDDAMSEIHGRDNCKPMDTSNAAANAESGGGVADSSDVPDSKRLTREHFKISEMKPASDESISANERSDSTEVGPSDNLDKGYINLENNKIMDDGMNANGNAAMPVELPLPVVQVHSSPSCDERDEEHRHFENEASEIGKAISSDFPMRKSSRCREKQKVASPTPENTRKTKSRRSVEAEHRRQEKEKEKQERTKLREQQRLAKEREKMEVLQKKVEEKVRKEEERRRKRDEEEAAKAERCRIKEDERRRKREEEEAAKADRLRKLEQKKKEKERAELEKKLDKERKEEEKRKDKEKKEEDKRQKEVEKLKIEKEKQYAEDEKRRKNEKRAEAFKSFFKSTGRSPAVKKSVDKIGIFVPFQRKRDMSLAPIHRCVLTDAKRAALELILNSEVAISSKYLQEIAERPRVMYGPTIPKNRKKYISLEEDGLEIINDTNVGTESVCAKFLSFHVNNRPPYYGTWRKKSSILSYKNPFKKDTDIFDYEFDSDDEWEEPADGEDIDHSDGEDEGEGNEEDEDDGFFVPHGYLSDDEGIGEEGEELGVKPDHKLRQKQLEFEASFKRKLSALTPVVIGCIWKDSAIELQKVHQEIMGSYKPEFICKLPISISSQGNITEIEKDFPDDASKSDLSKVKTKFGVPDEAMPDLIRLLHGNPLGIGRIVREFQSYWRLKNIDIETIYGPAPFDGSVDCQERENLGKSKMKIDLSVANHPCMLADVDSTTPKKGLAEKEISKSKLKARCKEIATYTKKDNMNRSCWFVHDTFLVEYGMECGVTTMLCRWNYITDVPKVLMFPKSEKANVADHSSNLGTPKQEGLNCITRFASVVSPDTILGLSKLKHEKEKSTQQPSSCLISKFTTEKVSPCAMIEKSAQKISEEKLLRAKEPVARKIIPADTQEGVYIIPSREAVKTFFKLDEISCETSEATK